MRMNDEACFRRGRSAADVCNWLRRTVITNERVHCQTAELLRRNENYIVRGKTTGPPIVRITATIVKIITDESCAFRFVVIK